MRILRMIIAIPISAFICAVLAGLLINELANQHTYGLGNEGFFSGWSLLILLVLMVSLGLFVFIAAFIMPAPKKIGVYIALGIGAALEVYMLGIQVKYDLSWDLVARVATAYLAILGSMAAGFYISFITFKDKGWHRRPEPITLEDLEKAHEDATY